MWACVCVCGVGAWVGCFLWPAHARGCFLVLLTHARVRPPAPPPTHTSPNRHPPDPAAHTPPRTTHNNSLNDLVGSDIGLHVGKNFVEAFSERVYISYLIPLLNEKKRLGEKTGKGFYKVCVWVWCVCVCAFARGRAVLGLCARARSTPPKTHKPALNTHNTRANNTRTVRRPAARERRPRGQGAAGRERQADGHHRKGVRRRGAQALAAGDHRVYLLPRRQRGVKGGGGGGACMHARVE